MVWSDPKQAPAFTATGPLHEIPLRILINKSLPAWLFIFSLLVFAGGLGGDFVMDDWPVIKENSRITDSQYIPDYFTRGVWANTDLAAQTGVGGHSLYRPLFLLTLNLEHRLWGDNPLGYHAVNLLLHATNTVLVYFLILGLLGSGQRMIAAMAAALFAVHPVHVESVAWIAGLTDPLVSLFLLAAFLLHRRARQAADARQAWPYAIAAPLCFALALLTKETAIFFPLLLLVDDALLQRGGLSLKSTVLRYTPYLLLLVVYFMLRSNALGTGQQGALAQMQLQNLPTLVIFLAHYLQLLVFPTPLEYYYSPPANHGFSLVIGGLILLAALAYLPRALRRQQRAYVLALAWATIPLLPALPIALLDEPVFAERVLYLPTLGFALFIAWLLRLAQGFRRPLEATVKTGVIVFLLVFSMASLSEFSQWENDKSFYSQAMKTSPDSYKPMAGLAAVYAREKNFEAAIDLYLKAAKLAPRQSDQLDFTENAARLYGQTGKIKQSEA
ncbi:MAG TPA: phospholipid carrier-dependent glycosyltransferase, partial [Gammaproteobacteria bacterium]|nr:phospholipid carrier-dependent glycosyltransferase [Gammaproteobacteria bacterium]